jgi:hypothetical protein
MPLCIGPLAKDLRTYYGVLMRAPQEGPDLAKQWKINGLL